ncbi:hypothetical protein AAX29_02060 [Aliarcobacter thereius]|uniref:Uncharacterized protein n=1 Tax=Aliarcobacter thereius TaxID=544718 RepID=A0A1C0B2M7_9BACT|nr:hypothetical protein AAX29_02060 [Aliarcobacter thereius]
MLYKLKALCDRPDTIKDLFDLYFILRDLENIDIKTLIEDINKKFEDAIGIKYSIENIISSLNHNLDWDIEIGEHINHLHDLKLEIDLFQKELKNALELGLDKNDYVDVIEDNQFIVEEWNKYFKN